MTIPGIIKCGFLFLLTWNQRKAGHAFRSISISKSPSRPVLPPPFRAGPESATSLLPPAISIEGLSCTHDGGGTYYQLKDVKYYVLARGAKVSLIGRKNGSGRSSFLKIASCRTRNPRNHQFWRHHHELSVHWKSRSRSNPTGGSRRTRTPDAFQYYRGRRTVWCFVPDDSGGWIIEQCL